MANLDVVTAHSKMGFGVFAEICLILLQLQASLRSHTWMLVSAAAVPLALIMRKVKIGAGAPINLFGVHSDPQ